MSKIKKQYTLRVRMSNNSYRVIPRIPLTTHFPLIWYELAVYIRKYLCNTVLMLDKHAGLHIVHYRNIVKGNTANNAGGWRGAVGVHARVGRAPEESPPQGVEYIVTTSPTKCDPKIAFSGDN